MAHRIYQLKVSLQGTAPSIWRRILVSANLPLRQASGVLPQAMGWTGSLNYCFRLDGREFGRYRGESVYFEDDTMFSLRSCLCAPGDMSSPLKPIPKFRSEDDEREFWATKGRDSTQYLDWSKARLARFPNLKPSTRGAAVKKPS